MQSWRISPNKKIEDAVIYGEPLFAKIIAEHLSIELLEPDLDWLTTLSKNYVKRNIIFTTLETVKNIQKAAFIKPAADKCFPAKVYNSGEELTQIESLPKDTLILISEPVDWEIEFRCFVCDRETAHYGDRAIKTMSSYWRNGQSTEQDDGSWYATELEYKQAAEFCHKVINDPLVKIPNAVVDVGKIRGK